MRDEVDHGAPIPRPVVSEVARLLGYAAHTTVRVGIEADRVTVVTAEVIDHQVVDVMHVHRIV